MHRSRSLAVVFAVLLLCGGSLAVAGCGSEDTDTPSSATTKQPSAGERDASSTSASSEPDAPVAQTRSQVKEVVYAIESCAAMNVSGAYAGSAGDTDCLDPAELTKLEPTIAGVLTSTTLKPIRDGGANAPVLGFAVTVDGEFNGADLSFTETHAADGQITKTCTPEGVGGCGADGTW